MTTKGWEKELKDNCIKRWGSCVFTPRCHEFNELKDFIRSLLKAQREELVGEIEKAMPSHDAVQKVLAHLKERECKHDFKDWGIDPTYTHCRKCGEKLPKFNLKEREK